MVEKVSQRTGVTGKGGIWRKSHQTPDPPLGAADPKVWANARTCPVHRIKMAGHHFSRKDTACPENAVLGVFF